MDISDINKLVPFLEPKQYVNCFDSREKNKSTNLDQAIKDGVIKKR
jgi:hypothetical protein